MFPVKRKKKKLFVLESSKSLVNKMLVPLIPLVTDYKNKTSNKVIKILVDTVTNDDHDVKQISVVAV